MTAIMSHSGIYSQSFISLEEEKELLDLANAGCKRSINRLIQAHSPLLTSICRKLFAKSQEDFEQQAWLEAYQLITEFKGTGRVGGFLKKYLPKRLMSFKSHSSYSVRLTDHAVSKFRAGLAPELDNLMQQKTSEAIDYYLESTDLPHEIVEAQDSQKFVQTAIESLPKQHQHVIKQVFVKGVRVAEIAAELGMTNAGAYRIRKAALERLEQYPGLNELMPRTADFTALDSVVEFEPQESRPRKKSFVEHLLSLTPESVLYIMSTFVPQRLMKISLPFRQRKRSVPNYIKLENRLRLASIPFSVLAFNHDVAWAIPALALNIYVAHRGLLRSLKTLPPKAVFACSAASILALSFYASPVFAQIQFSFLLGSTEDMLKSCFFTNNVIVTFLIGALAALFRGYVMFSLGHEAFDFVQSKRNDQNGTHHLKNIGWGLMAFIIVGAFEPYAARSCAPLAPGGVGPTPPAPTAPPAP